MGILDPPHELAILDAPDGDRRAGAGPHDQPGPVGREGQMEGTDGERAVRDDPRKPVVARLPLAGREVLNDFSWVSARRK